MSDNALKDKLKKVLEPSIELKERQLKEHRVTTRYEDFQESQETIKLLGEFDPASSQDLNKWDNETTDLVKKARDRAIFLNDELTRAVPNSAPNLIMVAGNTGGAKTTTASNLTFSMFMRSERCLYIANEERAVDVVNRVACLDLGYNYNDHAHFSDDQLGRLRDKRVQVAQYLNVCSNDQGVKSLTSSIDGLEQIFKKVAAAKEDYGAIIIDYFQNIDEWKARAGATKYDILAKASSLLDKYAKLVKAPIIVLVQLKPKDKHNETFESRIKEAKRILQVSTCALELETFVDARITKVTVQKARFGTAGAAYYLKYDRGRLLESVDPVDAESLIAEKAAEKKAKNKEAEADDVPEKKPYKSSGRKGNLALTRTQTVKLPWESE